MTAGPSGTAGPRPPVSVVVPAYNGALTIIRTLESIAAQTYTPLELIVVDDASTDGLPSLVENFLAGESVPGRLLRHPTNEGLSRTLNDGWHAAQGELVLIIHQDIELLGTDWISRAVEGLAEQENVQVVTCHYGIPARAELTFASRTFGLLRRQLYEAPAAGREFVTFTEFKCDLVRKATLERLGGFPTDFRLAGEDIVVSYRIRQGGGRILKAYDLKVVQRFEGTSGSVGGNLWKEYRFGMAFAGVLVAFRGFAFRGLDSSAYSRARSLHRASQPVVAVALLVLLVAGIAFGWAWALVGLVAVVAVRYAFYAVQLWPDFRRSLPGRDRALAETLGAALLGLVTDLVYPAGVVAGLARSAVGAPL